jgi:hypothetical protein
MNRDLKEREFTSNLVTSYEDFTPTGLRKLALDMEEQQIKSITFYATEEYGNAVFVCRETRLETELERDVRVLQEQRDEQRREEWERRQFELLKQKFGS